WRARDRLDAARGDGQQVLRAARRDLLRFRAGEGRREDALRLALPCPRRAYPARRLPVGIACLCAGSTRLPGPALRRSICLIVSDGLQLRAGGVGSLIGRTLPVLWSKGDK